jgi:hypothetical protein
MLRFALSAALLASYGPYAGAQTVGESTVDYACEDLVVTGRLRTLNFTPVVTEGDLLGHGAATARLRVAELIQGHDKRRELPVRYTAHVPIRGDRDFLFILSPGPGDTYSVRQVTGLNEVRTSRPNPACDRTSK